MRVSLSVKVIVFVALLLGVELGFVGMLSNIHQQAEAEVERSMKSKRVIDALNIISKEMYKMVLVFNNSTFNIVTVQKEDLDSAQRVSMEQYEILKEEFKDDAANLAIVKASERAALQGLLLFRTIQLDPSQLLQLNDPVFRRGQLKKLKVFAKSVMSEEFVDLGRQEKRIFEDSHLNQSNLRNQQEQTLFGGIIVTVMISLAITFYLVRRVAMRLNTMTENTQRLAAGKPLHEAMTGTDEIAQLDQTFHDMAEALRESARKERAVIENARDVICSLDEEGKFLAVNPAASRLFLRDPADLIGRRYISLIYGEDVHNVLHSVENIMRGAQQEETQDSFEARVVRPNGEIIDTMWSVHWSSRDRSLFCVVHDETERKQAERMKQEVVAMVTHDLRTPVAIVRNFLEMLDNKMLGELNQKGQDLAKVADRSTMQMLSLINDLLDIEKIKAGMLQLYVEDIPLKDLLETACKPMQSLAEDLHINVQVEALDVEVRADEERVVRVITNLLSNALKFSPQSSTITVKAQIKDNYAVVSVCDQGRGIPRGLLPTIFDRFTQVKASDARVKGGSGLGLAICKAIVELHGGNIWVESTEDKGSTFSFTLPTVGAMPCVAPAQESRDETGQTGKNGKNAKSETHESEVS